MPDGNNDTQSPSTLSTEHQRDGDARVPADTLDRGQSAGAPESVEPTNMPGTAEDIDVGDDGSTTGPSG
jgi:hypothetical protein